MEINDDLKIVFFSPTDGTAKVWELALHVGFARTDLEGPITNRDAHVIQPINGALSLQKGVSVHQPRTQHLRFPESHPQ
jgi:hypothetical protein